MSYQPRKRSRSGVVPGDYLGTDFAKARQRAFWANRRFSGLHPWTSHGAARIERGTPISLDMFGPSYAMASDAQKSMRKSTGFTGRGKYTFGSFLRDVESIGRRAERTADRALSKGIPKLVGTVKALSGRGLYSGRGMYSKNALIQGGAPTMKYSTGAADNQEVLLTHCEYLQDVYGPADASFTNNQLDLNPGILENFPFLGQIASNYEEYEFIQLVFHFKSTVDASISSTGTTGTLIMATNYNADAPAFLSKEAMMQYHGANNTRLDKDMDHGVECDPSKNAGTAIRYTRLMPVVDGQQKKEFDLGKFQWAIVNIPSQFQNQQVGELWVSYQVKLSKPKLAVSLGRTIAEDRFISNGGESTTSILGTNLLKLAQNNIGVKLTEFTPAAGLVNVVVTFPNFLTGRFEVQLRKYADGMGTGAHTVAGNVSFVSDLWTGASYNNGTVNFGDAGSSACIICHVDVRPATAGVDNTLTILCSSVSASACEIIVRPYNPDIVFNQWEDSSGQTVIPS